MIIKIEILKLNTKTLASGSTPVKILKQFVETYLPFLTNAIDLAISESEFPDKFKISEVIPMYKKQHSLKKDNHGCVSSLQHVSKVFEHILTRK